MGMGFENCLSGLNSCAKALEVVGNNISNSNTVGFKAGQTRFADVFAATLSGSGSSSPAGLGSKVVEVVGSFTQGEIRSTNNPVDMAISGKGFFRLNDAGSISYSRNGEFHVEGVPFPAGTTPTVEEIENQQLMLVNSQGLNLTGYLASYATNPLGVIESTAGTPQNIVIDSWMPGAATGNVELNLNLDAGAAVPAVAPFDPNDSRTYNHIALVEAYQDDGMPRDIQIGFVRTVDAWDMHVLDGGRAVGSIDLGAMTTPIDIPSGDSRFDIAIDNETAVTATLPATSFTDMDALRAGVQSAIDVALGAERATVSLDADNHLVVSSREFGTNSTVSIAGGSTYFGTVAATSGIDEGRTVTFDTSGRIVPADRIQLVDIDLGTGMPIAFNLGNTTQYAGGFGVNRLAQDGFPRGRIANLSVSSQGVVEAYYANGQTRKTAQVVLADFPNPMGLVNIGSNQWQASIVSGQEDLDTPANRDPAVSNGMGSIVGSAVEESNIDLNQQLVDLIVQQRYYQANAQAIKTQDQILQTLAGIR